MKSLEVKKLKSDIYHKFIPRSTKLDLLLESTEISEFRGFYNLLSVLVFIYFFSNLITKNIFNINLYSIDTLSVFDDLFYLIKIWILFFLITWIAVLVQKLILFEYNKTAYVLQYSFEMLIFTIAFLICYYIKKPLPHIFFIITKACIHYFKMHSYFLINRDYRENYLLRMQKPGENIESTSIYPQNLSISNYFYYLAAPTLVYQDNFPRSAKFRLSYAIQKFISCVVCLVSMYFLFNEYIKSHLQYIDKVSIFESVIKIYLPFITLTLLFFIFLFECICPFYAELTCFGDRLFYDDFWNSTDQDEFSRKWNRVVHNYLYFHVYSELIKRHDFSKTCAKWLTYLYSAVFHEVFLILTFWVFSPFFAFLMMLQIPLVGFSNKIFGKSTFGSYFFWFGIILGMPLLYLHYNLAFLNKRKF